MYGGEKMSAEIQQSLLIEEQRLKEAEAERYTRQRAFRVAFDFLDHHLPVLETEEYWLKVCEDLSVTSAENIDNRLCQELLSAVLIYMSNTIK